MTQETMKETRTSRLPFFCHPKRLEVPTFNPVDRLIGRRAMGIAPKAGDSPVVARTSESSQYGTYRVGSRSLPPDDQPTDTVGALAVRYGWYVLRTRIPATK